VRCALALVATLALAVPHVARADPYRLRAEALGQSRADRAGLIVLGGRGQPHEWVSAEASVWAGLGTEVDGDVLTLLVRVRDPGGLGEVQLGRFVVGPGAIRPVHLDGAAGRLRLPLGFGLELFGGIPVAPRFEALGQLDWIAGGRISHALGDWGSFGFAYAHRRDDGFLADQELGVDVGAALADFADVAARVAMDLTDDPGLSEANLSVALHDGPWRLELFGIERSPSRILPASSLFTVLGDVPSTLAGANGRLRVAPRLDVRTTLAARVFGDVVYESLAVGATLRLDDLGEGAIGIEGRREGTPEGGWTGVRITARVPIVGSFRASTELELVVPDDDQRGSVWPWGLVALAYTIAEGWDVSAAALASASAQYSFRFDALVRLSAAWEGT
jgi:hypothetical protein